MTNVSLNTTHISHFVSYYPHAVALSLVLLFGVSGNIMVIYSILKEGNLFKRNYYYLVLHLSICDLITLLLQIRSNSFIDMQYPNVICKLLFLVGTLFFIVGVYIMVLIAIFRYRAILYPLAPTVSRRKLRAIVAAVYLCAMICLVWTIFAFKIYSYERCLELANTLFAPYTISFVAIQWFIPVAILSILYYKICQQLMGQKAKMDSLNATCTASSEDFIGIKFHLQKMKHSRNNRTVITSVTIVVCFAIASFPFQLYWLLLASGVNVNYSYFYDWSDVVCLLGVSTVNPYIYGVSDKTLRLVYNRNWNKIKAFFTSCSTSQALAQ